MDANQIANAIAGFHMIIVMFLFGGLLFLAIPALFKKQQPPLYYLWIVVAFTTFGSQLLFWGCPLTYAEAYFRQGSNAGSGFLKFYILGGGGDILAILPYALYEALIIALIWFGATGILVKKPKNSE